VKPQIRHRNPYQALTLHLQETQIYKASGIEKEKQSLMLCWTICGIKIKASTWNYERTEEP